MPTRWTLDPDRCFSSVPNVRQRARELYEEVRDLPLVCPHGHIEPALLSDPDSRFGDPAELFIIPDHYVVRMLYSQGVAMEDLGIPSRDGSPVESDRREVWRRFCENFHLFRGTPTGLWLKAELIELFGLEEKLTAATADSTFDALQAKLQQDEFRPRALFDSFGIEALATTDAATDDLSEHEQLRSQGLPIVPTFRPDKVLHLAQEGWREELATLEQQTESSIASVAGLLSALRQRRAYFKERGGTATDHAALTPETKRLSSSEAEAILARALRGAAEPDDDARFHGHMLLEMAAMSREDGLTMQIHVGSFRNHHSRIFERFGTDKGADIPIAVDWTRGLRPLLDEHGHDSDFRLVLYTLDEGTYSRELAPLAGHYPALRLGAPWWFFDSVLGMDRYLDRTVETAGIYNLAGFNDDTRAFASIPTRHDVWRRTACNWLAGMVERGLVDGEDAPEMARWLSYDAGKEAYRLDGAGEGATVRQR